MTLDVHLRVDGNQSAPPVLLSNSLGTTLDMWDEQMPSLEPHFRVIRYDQRGHGDSPVPPGPYTFDELGHDVLELLDRLELERVSFCGASMGGMTGMWLAINNPERVDCLAVCCTSAHIPPREGWLERAALVRGRGTEAIADASLERWFTPALRRRRPERVEAMRETLLTIDPEGYAACCEALADTDLRDQLDEIRCPTLVITGEDDLSTPPDHGTQIAGTVQDGSCLMLSPARHLANVERAEEVNRALLGHLLRGATG